MARNLKVILAASLMLANASMARGSKADCMLAVTNGIDELMDAGVYLWGATERCSKAGNGLQCSSDIFSVIENVLRMSSFIVKSVKACGGTGGAHKCELTSLKLSSATSGLMAASLEMGASCKPQGSIPPGKKYPLTGNANCLGNIGGALTSLGTALSELTMVKKKCSDPVRCSAEVLDILSAIAHIGQCIWQTVEGSCIINAQLIPYNNCAQAIVAGSESLLQLGSAALVVASDCKSTTPSRLYETPEIETTTASSSMTPLNAGLVVLFPLTAVAAFTRGAHDAKKNLVGPRTAEFVAGIE